jgi:hypothetical protein
LSKTPGFIYLPFVDIFKMCIYSILWHLLKVCISSVCELFLIDTEFNLSFQVYFTFHLNIYSSS